MHTVWHAPVRAHPQSIHHRLHTRYATNARAHARKQCHAQTVGNAEASVSFIAKVPGVQVVRTLSDEPWTSPSPQVLEIKRKGPAKAAGDQGKSATSTPPTWRLWPLCSDSGEVAGYVNLHLPLLDDGLIIKGVPSLRGSGGDKKVVDLYLFASSPSTHTAAARCAEQHWLQPLVKPDQHGSCVSQPGDQILRSSSSSTSSSDALQPEQLNGNTLQVPHQHGNSVSQADDHNSIASSSSSSSITQAAEQLNGGLLQASVTEQLLLGDQIPTGTHSSSSTALQPEQLDAWVMGQSQFAHTRLQDCMSDPELARWAQLQLPQEHTFGVEVELLVWRDISQRDLQDLLENQACVAGWRVVRDGSINAPSRGCTAVEVISPVMQGMDGLAQIHRVMAVLVSLPAAANPSCALHVHVGKHGGWDHEHLKHLLRLFATYEPTLDLLVPTHRQGNNNQHCTSVAVPPSGGGGASEAAQRSQDMSSLVNAANPYGRTYKLNVRSLAQHGTVEFRHPGSSCSAHAVCGFVALYLLLAQAASQMAKAGTNQASSDTQQLHASTALGPADVEVSRVPVNSGDGDLGPIDGGSLGPTDEGQSQEGHAQIGVSVCSREQDGAGDAQLGFAGEVLGGGAVERLRTLAAELRAPSILEWLLWQAASVKSPAS